MESFPFFFRIRAITFTCIMLFSFLWLVLLYVESFARWSVSDEISHSLMILFIITNTITLIMLPILILVKFRIWLDTARLLLLFVLQVGSATSGTYWSPKIQCPDQTPDDVGVCQLIGAYTMIACWIIPLILVFYSTYFAVVVYLQSRIPVVVERSTGVDPEIGSAGSLSLWQEKLQEISVTRRSTADAGFRPRPLVLPSLDQAGPSSSSTPQSTLPNSPLRQSTVPSSSQSYPVLPSVPSRHQSLPAFRHGSAPHLPLKLTIPRPLANNASISQPPTPSSNTLSTSSPGIADARFSRDHRAGSRHLSMMPFSSSPGEMQSGEWSPVRSKRARLSKPLPAHLL